MWQLYMILHTGKFQLREMRQAETGDDDQSTPYIHMG